MALTDVFARVLEEPVEAVDEETSRDTCLNWTSMRHVALLVELEKEYGIRFSNPEMTTMRSVADVRAALTAKGVSGL
jgi:acyl carrier protein